MSQLEEIWRSKSDRQVIDAALCLGESSDEARAIILAEANRRGINYAPLVKATTALRTQPSTGRRCDYCGTRILFGGKRENELRFCNEDCRQRGVLIAVSRQIPDDTVNERVGRIFSGTCPQCGGRGPVDVHTSYLAWSAVVVTYLDESSSGELQRVRHQSQSARCRTFLSARVVGAPVGAYRHASPGGAKPRLSESRDAFATIDAARGAREIGPGKPATGLGANLASREMIPAPPGMMACAPIPAKHRVCDVTPACFVRRHL